MKSYLGRIYSIDVLSLLLLTLLLLIASFALLFSYSSSAQNFDQEALVEIEETKGVYAQDNEKSEIFPDERYGYFQSFQDSLAMAYENSDTIKSSYYNLERSIKTTKLNVAQWFPVLSAGMNTLKSKKKLDSVSPVKQWSDWKGGYHFGISSKIFDLSYPAKFQAAENSIAVSALSYDLSKEKVFQDLLSAYSGIIVEREALKLAQSHLKSLLLQEEINYIKENAGYGSRLDTLLAKSARIDSELLVEKSKYNLKKYSVAFENLVGIDPSDRALSINLSGIDADSKFEDFSVPKDWKTAFSMFLVNNKKYKMISYKNTADKASAAATSLQDVVSLKAFFNAINKDMVDNPKDLEYTVGIGVEVKLPLAYPLVLSGLDDLEKSSDAKAASQFKVLREKVYNLWNNFSAIKASVLNMESGVKAQEAYYEALKEKTDVGVTVLKNKIDASNKLLEKKIGLLKAKRNYMLNYYMLFFALAEA